MMTANNNPTHHVKASDLCLINQRSAKLASIAPDLHILFACKDTLFVIFSQRAFVEFPMAYCWEMMKQCADLANATGKTVKVPMAYRSFLWIKPDINFMELTTEHGRVCDILSTARGVWATIFSAEFREFSVL